MDFNYKLNGFEGLQEKLQHLPERIEKRVLQGAVTSAIREGGKEIRKAAPRHIDKQSPASKRYGPLFKNIKIKRLRRVERGQKGARVDTGNAFWGYFYELGTRYQSARPWFAPAFRRASAAMMETLAEKISAGIVRESEKLWSGSKR